MQGPNHSLPAGRNVTGYSPLGKRVWLKEAVPGEVGVSGEAQPAGSLRGGACSAPRLRPGPWSLPRL